MSRDSERGIGYLVGHEEPETKAQRVREIKRQIESSVRPSSEPIDIFSSLPLATVVNLGTRDSLATPEITSPAKPKRKGPTKGQIYRGAMEWLTDRNSGNSKGTWEKFVKERQDTLKRKPYDWSPLTKNAAKVMNEEAGVTSPTDAKQKKQPYWVNYNGELLDGNNAEHWQSVTKTVEKERFNDRIQEQDKISVSDNKVKGTFSPRNEVANRKPKILKTKMGNVKIIPTTQKDIADKQRRKI